MSFREHKGFFLSGIIIGFMLISCSYAIAWINGDPSPSALIGEPDMQEYPMGSDEAYFQYADANEDILRPNTMTPTPLAPEIPDRGSVSYSPSDADYSNLDDADIGDPDDYAETDYTV